MRSKFEKKYTDRDLDLIEKLKEKELIDIFILNI